MLKNPSFCARLFFLGLFTVLWGTVQAQTNPTDSTEFPGDPGAGALSNVQGLNFGAFSVTGGGGTVTISPGGQRSATGGVLLLNMGLLPSPAIFELEVGENTTLVSLYAPPVTLTGPGGATLLLTPGPSDPVFPFITTAVPPLRTIINLGGTLTIGPSGTAPPGQYSGTFDIIINYQ